VRRFLYAVLLTGLFVLMLSALVVEPEPPPMPEPPPLPADLHAVFRPLISAILPDAAALPSSRPELRPVLCLIPLLLLCAVILTGARDANGRVLTAVRYENSVYQLFRAEVAGG